MCGPSQFKPVLLIGQLYTANITKDTESDGCKEN